MKKEKEPEMTDTPDKDLKCIEYFCPRFQTCARAVLYCGTGACLEGEVLSATKCMNLPDKPYYKAQQERET